MRWTLLSTFSLRIDLKNRSLKDILIACCDGLKGFPLFDYPREIRRVIYTINVIESLNRSLREVIKINVVFPDEAAVYRLMYLTMNNISKKWNRLIKDWRAALLHFAILFSECFSL